MKYEQLAAFLATNAVVGELLTRVRVLKNTLYTYFGSKDRRLLNVEKVVMHLL